MKKFFIGALVVLLIVSLAILIGFAIKGEEETAETDVLEDAFSSRRFKLIAGEGSSFNYREEIIVDTETGVMYLWIVNGHRAGLTPLYNSDGTVMIWEGSDKLQMDYTSDPNE